MQPAFCNESKETRCTSASENLPRTYAFISRIYTSRITMTMIALYNPSIHHNWISLTYATRLSNKLDSNAAVNCPNCEEAGLAKGVVELEWSCNGMGSRRLRTTFLISPLGQFSILFGHDEKRGSLPFKLLSCRNLHNGHSNSRNKESVNSLETGDERFSEEILLKNVLQEGLFVEVEEVSMNSERPCLTLEDVSANIDPAVYSTGEGNTSRKPQSEPQSEPISLTTAQHWRSPSPTARTEIHSHFSSDSQQHTTESGEISRSAATEVSKDEMKWSFRTSTRDTGRIGYLDLATMSSSSKSNFERLKGTEECDNFTFRSESDTTSSVDDSHSAPSEMTRSSTITLDSPVEETQSPRETQTSDFQQLFKTVDQLDQPCNVEGSPSNENASFSHNFAPETLITSGVKEEKSTPVAIAVFDDVPKLGDSKIPGGIDFTHDSTDDALAVLKSDKLVLIDSWLRCEEKHEKIAMGLSRLPIGLGREEYKKRPSNCVTWPLDSRTGKIIEAPSTARWIGTPSIVNEPDKLPRSTIVDEYIRKVADEYWRWDDDLKDHYHDDPDGTRIWYNVSAG